LQDKQTGIPSSTGMAEMRIGHYQGVGMNLDVYTDDTYIDTTRARVEIGNAPTWAQSNVREIQIPSAWSNSSITITINQGAFSNGDTVYLYVVDSNGNVNSNGYPVTIGGISSTNPPSPPTGLYVIAAP
jgi:gamma-glutamyltranspeptidase